MPNGEQKFWDFKKALVDMIPESPEGFLELEPHHMEACLQVAALYAALRMEGIDFAAHAITAFKDAEDIVISREMPEAPTLTVMDGGKESDGTRSTC